MLGSYLERRKFIMILVGVDVASSKHDVAIMRDDGTIIKENLTIPNKEVGYKKLLEQIENAKKLYPDDDVRIGLESTGVYSVALTEFLARIYQDSVILINPILTSMFQLSIQVHYAKTDKKDALGICKFLSKNQDIRPYTQVSYHTKQLRYYYRERIKLNKRINQDINRLKGIIHITFPEFLSKKHETLGKFELEFLSRYPSAYSLKKKKANALAKEISKVKNIKVTAEKAQALITLANSSIASCEGEYDFSVKQIVQRIKLYKKQIKEIDEALVFIVKKEYPYLLTIPGVGAVSIAGIVGEIGNVNNYHGSDSIVALAGLNPIVYESGNYKAPHTRISKKGSSYLRNAFFLATQSMYLHKVNPIYDYVNKKRAEGKKKTCALNHGARKLCGIFFSMLKNKQEFQSEVK